MPMAIRVNMFGLRLTIEAQPRAKKGSPPQRTTGVARASSIQTAARPEKRCESGWPGIISDIAMRRSGAERARHTQNLRLMSSSSGLVSSPVAIIGSRAIPQIGQLPGLSRTISGCIGQV